MYTHSTQQHEKNIQEKRVFQIAKKRLADEAVLAIWNVFKLIL